MSLKKADTIVIYAPIKDVDTSSRVHPEERHIEILGCKSEKARREKYLAWQLLRKTAESYFNVDFDNLTFTKTANGKWICPDFHFSISHTDGLVCVAASSSPVGVDAELVRDISLGFCERVLTARELASLERLAQPERAEYLLEAWVKKESIFKKAGGEALMPNRIEADEHCTELRKITLGERAYLISLCCDSNDETEFKYMEEI